jgi:hypothetical protein
LLESLVITLSARTLPTGQPSPALWSTSEELSITDSNSLQMILLFMDARLIRTRTWAQIRQLCTQPRVQCSSLLLEPSRGFSNFSLVSLHC